MRLSRTERRFVTAIAAAGALVLTSGAVAVAAYSGVASSGQILACWQNSNGALRIVDHFPCRPSETPLTWNQKGEKGATGATGATGPAGAAGAPGPAGPAGATGAAGPAGGPGPAGANGQNGLPGTNGLNGTVADQSCPVGKVVSGFQNGAIVCTDLATSGGGGPPVATDSDLDGTPDATDCAPTNPNINPEATEVADAQDNDCDGEIDEGFASFAPVEGLTATTVSSSSVRLSWTYPVGDALDQLIVRRATGGIAPASPDEGDVVLAPTPGAAGSLGSLNDSGLIQGTTYSYAVFSRNANLDTSAPETATASTVPGPVDALVGAPLGTGGTAVRLSWTCPVGDVLAQLIVRRAEGSVAPTAPDEGIDVPVFGAPSPPGGNMVLEDFDLSPGTTYSYAVFSLGAGGTSTPATTTVSLP